MGKKRNRTQNTLPRRKAPQRANQTPQATDQGFVSRIGVVETVADIVTSVSRGTGEFLLWMMQNKMLSQKNEPYVTGVAVKGLSEDTGVPPQSIVAALEEIGDYMAPANEAGMMMRVVTLLGVVHGPDGQPDTAIIYVTPVRLEPSEDANGGDGA